VCKGVGWAVTLFWCPRYACWWLSLVFFSLLEGEGNTESVNAKTPTRSKAVFCLVLVLF